MCSTLITSLWSAAATHTNFWSCTMLNCFRRSVQTPAPLAPTPPRELLRLLPSLKTPFSHPPPCCQPNAGTNPTSPPPPTAHTCITGSYRVRSAARVTFAVAVPPPSNNVFPTSSGPQLCVGKLRPLPVAPADPHASAGNIPSPHRCVKNVVKCVRGYE